MVGSDIVVIVPGIGGSVLTKRGATLWDTSVRVFLKTLLTGGEALEQLVPRANGSDDGVAATKLIDGVNLIPGFWSYGSYSPLRNRLSRLLGSDRVVEFPYDWRRGNAQTADKLEAMLESKLRGYSADARVVIVAHSMGGLVARRFLATSSLAERCRMLITIGTPYRGAVKALSALAMGVGRGRAGRRLTALLRSLPSVYELLPTYDCLLEPDGTRTNLADNTGLVPDSGMLKGAIEFHAATNAAMTDPVTGADTIAIVGQRQRTHVLARRTDRGVELIEDDTWTVSGSDENPLHIPGAGDGTVPRGASQPPEWGMSVRGAHHFSGRHMNLPQLKSVWNAIEGAITAERFMHLGDNPEDGFGIGFAETIEAGEDLAVEALHSGDDTLALDLRVRDTTEQRIVGSSQRLRNDGSGQYSARVQGLEPGLYEVIVSGVVDGAPREVSDHLAVYPPS